MDFLIKAATYLLFFGGAAIAFVAGHYAGCKKALKAVLDSVDSERLSEYIAQNHFTDEDVEIVRKTERLFVACIMEEMRKW